MKKIFISLLCIVIVLTAFLICFRMGNHTAEDEQRTNEALVAGNIAELPIEEVETIAKQSANGLTSLDAEQLCAEVLGDKAKENGFPISYKCISAVSANDKLYYVMHITWLVNNSHWSYIGNCYVSFDGQEIYDGVVSGEEYEMTDLRWKK